MMTMIKGEPDFCQHIALIKMPHKVFPYKAFFRGKIYYAKAGGGNLFRILTYQGSSLRGIDV